MGVILTAKIQLNLAPIDIIESGVPSRVHSEMDVIMYLHIHIYKLYMTIHNIYHATLLLL